jgi:hypothetical protein
MTWFCSTGILVQSYKGFSMAKCEVEGCDDQATHSITLNIPAEGVAIDLHQPIKMYIGVERCHNHAKEFSKLPFDWDSNGPLRDAIDDSLFRHKSDMKPDYHRSFHSVVKMTEPGYIQFVEMSSKR